MMLSLFLIVGIFAILFHHHADGQDHADCVVCRLAQQVVSFFIFALIALVVLAVSSRKFFAVPLTNFTSLFLSSNLKDRAPPIFSC